MFSILVILSQKKLGQIHQKLSIFNKYLFEIFEFFLSDTNVILQKNNDTKTNKSK